MADILRLDKVHKWAGEGEARTDILKGISFSVQAGNYVAIMGPSGSGKSTLLNLMGLLDRPSTGTVSVFGQDTATLNEDALASLRARSLGFIFQNFNLLPYLNARQNVALPLGYSHPEKTSALSRVDRLLTRVGLAHRMQAYPATLSGGEKQRVAIARALANEPPLILADEPTGALDQRTGRQILELLGELHQGGATIVLITHDESVARRAEKVYLLRDGTFE